MAAAIDPRYKAAVLLAAYGGLRAGELFGLRAKRVDPLRRTVTIAETLVDVGGHPYFGPPKTRAGHRTIPLPRVAAEPLAEHLVTYGRKPDDLVFTAPEGGPVQLNVWRRRFWAPAVRGAGLAHLRPHDLRHTAVALWIAAGANPKEAATRAGHTSVSFTLDRYGHLFPGSEQRLNDALDLLADGASDDAVDVEDEPPEGPREPESELRARQNPICQDPICQNPISIAHVARTPESDTVSDGKPQAPDQGKKSGRCGTRTHDLSRVKADGPIANCGFGLRRSVRYSVPESLRATPVPLSKANAAPRCCCSALAAARSASDVRCEYNSIVIRAVLWPALACVTL